jgi:hypothetical protein
MPQSGATSRHAPPPASPPALSPLQRPSALPALSARLDALELSLATVSARENEVASYVRHVSRLVDESGERHGNWDARLVQMLEQDTRRSADVARKQEDLAAAFGLRTRGTPSPVWRALANIAFFLSLVLSVVIVTPLTAIRRLHERHRSPRAPLGGGAGSRSAELMRNCGTYGTTRNVGNRPGSNADTAAQRPASISSHRRQQPSSSPQPLDTSAVNVPSASALSLTDEEVSNDTFADLRQEGMSFRKFCNSGGPVFLQDTPSTGEESHLSTLYPDGASVAQRVDIEHGETSLRVVDVGGSVRSIHLDREEESNISSRRVSKTGGRDRANVNITGSGRGIDRADDFNSADKQDDDDSLMPRKPSWTSLEVSSSDVVETSSDFWGHFD